jgi:hypothetical protein
MGGTSVITVGAQADPRHAAIRARHTAVPEIETAY